MHHSGIYMTVIHVNYGKSCSAISYRFIARVKKFLEQLSFLRNKKQKLQSAGNKQLTD